MSQDCAARRPLLAALAPLALSGLSCAVLGGAPQPIAALPPVDAGPPAVAETAAPPTTADGAADAEVAPAQSDPQVAAALGFLRSRRTGLADFEEEKLATTIVDEARRNGLEPDLVLAVIAVESGGDAFAVSPVGAMGLMQVMPATGAELADRLGTVWRGPHELFDPFLNVRLGTAYLRELANRYGGSIDTALAAYNWGPGHIDRRLRRGTPLPVRYAKLVLDAYGDRKGEI